MVKYIYDVHLTAQKRERKTPWQELLKELYETTAILPQQIYTLINTLRLLGNQVAHPNDQHPNDQADARIAINIAIPIFLFIMEWFLCKILHIEITQSCVEGINQIGGSLNPEKANLSDPSSIQNIVEILNNNQNALKERLIYISEEIKTFDGNISTLKEKETMLRRDLSPLLQQQNQTHQGVLKLQGLTAEIEHALRRARKELKTRQKWVKKSSMSPLKGGTWWRLKDCKKQEAEWGARVNHEQQRFTENENLLLKKKLEQKTLEQNVAEQQLKIDRLLNTDMAKITEQKARKELEYSTLAKEFEEMQTNIKKLTQKI
jgi:hypothetical protein